VLDNKGQTTMTNIPEHFFVADDGGLHDTRQTNWHKHVLRANYRRSHQNINSVADFKATLRNGAYAWPGGYPIFLLANDGVSLCFECGRKEARNVINAISNKRNDGWRVVACNINYEDSDMTYVHCDKTIESAY
jgi:hypothetical protein